MSGPEEPPAQAAGQLTPAVASRALDELWRGPAERYVDELAMHLVSNGVNPQSFLPVDCVFRCNCVTMCQRALEADVSTLRSHVAFEFRQRAAKVRRDAEDFTRASRSWEEKKQDSHRGTSPRQMMG